MNPERWERIQRVFQAALEIDPENRAAYVERECGADAELRDQILRMLTFDGSETEFLDPPPPPPEDPITRDSDERRLGDFDLHEVIGRGGMGLVYRARQRSLGRDVAVKVLPQTLALTQRQIARFNREARAVAKLRHPGIVSIITVGEERGTHFFAMELVKGHDLAIELSVLRDEIEASKLDPARLPSSRARDYFNAVTRITRDVADALEFAHEHGIVHRDIKPSNLLLETNGAVKIVDFGLARDEQQGSITRTGDLAGTPHYMSPEQARARRQHVDHRTDVYSLGVVLYELLTLRRPFSGRTSREILNRILKDDPPRIRKLNPRVPRDLATICNKAMARESQDRYAGAGELRDDLERFLSHQAIHASGPSFGRLTVRCLERHWRKVAVSVALIIGVLLGVWLAGFAARQERQRDSIAAFEQALELEDLDSLPPERIADLRSRLHEVLSQGASLAPDHPAHRLAQKLARLKTTLVERANEDLAFSKNADHPYSQREARRLEALRTFLHVARLFPEDAELTRLARTESVYPSLSVRARDEGGAVVDAGVFAHDIHPETGQIGSSRFLGNTPVLGIPFAAGGYHRITVVFADGGFREFAYAPGLDLMEAEFVATRRADEDRIMDGMIGFGRTSYRFPDFPGGHVFRDETVEITPFLLDPTEVTNGDYYRFATATGHAMPRYWKLEPDLEAFLSRYGDHPVVGVDYVDAAAYAAWAGKRLPTSAEWHYAAGGAEGRPLPYPASPGDPLLGNIHGPHVPKVTEAEAWALYKKYSSPVTSHGDARTPEGAFHMYGNVAELTESMAVNLEPDSATPRERYRDRFYFGGAWDALSRGVEMHTFGWASAGPHFGRYYLGFRCAKSQGP